MMPRGSPVPPMAGLGPRIIPAWVDPLRQRLCGECPAPLQVATTGISNGVHTFHWMSSLDSGFSSMSTNLMFSTRAAVREMTRIISRKTLLEMTVRSNIKGAPTRSARIPNHVEALKPIAISKRANRTADSIDRLYRNFTILGLAN